MCETDFLLQIFCINGCMTVRVEPPGAHFQWIFITLFTGVHHWPISCATSIQSSLTLFL